MSSSTEPERFITVGRSELIVNGTVHAVAQTGGGEFRLRRPTALPAGEAEFRFRLYSDGGELLSDETKPARILEGCDEPRIAYRVETFSPAAAVA